MKKYSWNFDKSEEIWRNDSYSTIDECIVAAKEENNKNGGQHSVVYIGENMPYVPTVDIDSMFDQMEATAADEFGELGYEWQAYNHKEREQVAELEALLTPIVQAWMRKHNYYPEFWNIENVKEYRLA